jgi:hypothetical protein
VSRAEKEMASHVACHPAVASVLNPIGVDELNCVVCALNAHHYHEHDFRPFLKTDSASRYRMHCACVEIVNIIIRGSRPERHHLTVQKYVIWSEIFGAS